MKKIIFESNRSFSLFDVTTSHSQLLLRSQRNDEIMYNIDIIFFDTTYVQLCNKLNGVRIRMIDNAGVIDYQPVKKYLDYESNHLFEIESASERYYIAASFVRVFENQLEFNESSLGFENRGRDRELATSISV